MRSFIGFLLIALLAFGIGLAAQHRQSVFSTLDYHATRLHAWQLDAWQQNAARLDVLAKAVVRFPQDAPLQLDLAKAYDTLGYGQRAETHYLNALERNPKLYEALRGAARLSRKQKQWAEARSFNEQALHLNNRDPGLLSELGDLYLDAAQALPKPTRSYEWAAYGRRRTFRLHWAAYYYKKSLQLRPQHFRSRFELGYIRLEQRRPLAAAWNFCTALALKPHRYEARYNLGLALLEGGFPVHGYATLQQAVALLERTHDDTAAAQMRVQIQGLKRRFPLPEDLDPHLAARREGLWEELPQGCVMDLEKEKDRKSSP